MEGVRRPGLGGEWQRPEGMQVEELLLFPGFSVFVLIKWEMTECFQVLVQGEQPTVADGTSSAQERGCVGGPREAALNAPFWEDMVL